MTSPARSALERVFREQSGRVLAALIAGCGDFELAEDALQEAVEAALAHWPQGQLPERPGAWLLTAARRRVVDRQRHDRMRASKGSSLRAEETQRLAERVESETPMDEFPDERLRLVYTCCHPALAVDAQVALTLRSLGGLDTDEVARAFLVAPAAMARRLSRAKRKIRDAGIPYRVPPADALPERTGAVLSVIYLVFNEGWGAAGASGPRAELCEEALRLARILATLHDDTEVRGLLALMLLLHGRRDARLDAGGRWVPLESQDRDAFHWSEIREGLAILRDAWQRGDAGAYCVQASIAALHAESPGPGETRWDRIAALYARLEELAPSPVVALNRAVAEAHAFDDQRGLDRLLRTGADGGLDAYPPYHAARAELLRRAGRGEESRAAYTRAIELTSSLPERLHLERELGRLAQPS